MKVIVLAAGKSTRFKSSKHKVLHDLLGKNILKRVTEMALGLEPEEICFVLGHQKEILSDEINSFGIKDIRVTYAEQKEQLGTAHAVITGLKAIKTIEEKQDKGLLVLCGDVPLIKTETLKNLIAETKKNSGKIGLLTADLFNPFGYGRIVRDTADKKRRVIKIVEEKDATSEERRIREINSGIYYFDLSPEELLKLLSNVKNNNKQKEYYLTDLVSEASKKKIKVASYKCEDETEIYGINSKSELSKVIGLLSRRHIEYLQNEAGVLFTHPQSCLISPEVKIGTDTVIQQNCQILGQTEIGQNCLIGMNSCIENCKISDNVSIKMSNLIESEIEKNCSVGPFANIRPSTKLKENSLVGDFVEIKNSTLGKNSKASHLSYLGDAEIGDDVNIGAGVITANFDAIKNTKNKTKLGNGVKVGSNSVFVAPVEIADNCMIGAGTTVTKNVEKKNSLLINEKKDILKQDWLN